ncbi:glyoxylate/succinic semialdehyde reductase 2 [Populus alba x Populus x berolinensis]|uniref:Glyoxylate/succinic semialdehyde reductase 2 n=2 Tax=Populus TaxID=3689 RepID=A0AAD6R698_9ROSI|nr:glyoxylate/succinic semialdehyde reductase 2 [Populus alba x Populus x berolinensis]
MSLLLKASNGHLFLSSSIASMATCSSFCAQLPIHFRPIPISSSFPTYQPFKPFSAQASISTANVFAFKLELGLKTASAWRLQIEIHFMMSFKLSNESQTRNISPSCTYGGAPITVGFLGLGIMGSPMAQNLIKSGCDVTVWNRTKSKCDPLISLGAKYKPSPKEVTAACDVTFAMLADPECAVSIFYFNCLLNISYWKANSGLISGGGCMWKAWSCKWYGSRKRLKNSPGHHHINHSSFNSQEGRWEAPVSGSKKPAEDGQLIFLTAGDNSLYETVTPFLDIMGKSRFYLGEVGNGAAMKLIVNMIMGSMMATFSEGLLLSEKVGLDPNVLVEVASQGAINAPMYSLKGPSMVKSLYPTAFPLKHQQKDMRLALGLAESVSQPTPIAAAANELYKVAKSHGLSDSDFSAVIEALKGKVQS